MFVGKVKSLPYGGASERCFTWVGSGPTQKLERLLLELELLERLPVLGWKDLPLANTLAYYK
jgi:hypothetical protein